MNIALAQIQTPNTPLGGMLSSFLGLLNMVVMLLIAVAIFMFFYGLLGAFSKDKTKSTASKKILIQGLIIIFVVTTLGGILSFVARQFNWDVSSPQRLDSTPVQSRGLIVR
jgi:hypothetical protein